MSDAPATARTPVGQSLVSLAVTILVMGLALFVPAGTLAWARGWWFIGTFVVVTIIAVIYLARVNPEIFAARSRAARSGTKAWDYVFLVLLIGGFVAVLPVAGLDFRFGWAQSPDLVVVLGYVVFLAGYAVQTWSQAVNRHFEPSVRIQEDRGHSVIDTGPYAIVRHPGYISGSFLVIGAALALGSLWALVPAAETVVALVFRTVFEERTLVAELPGYAEFRQRTRYRWIPGVW